MIETFRSLVHPWECDSVDHFTTAYYFAAFSSANWHFLQRQGLDGPEIAALDLRSCQTRFMRELRAGEPYHIVSGLREQRPGTAVTGHQLFNSETGALAATLTLEFSGEVEKTEPIDWPDERPMDTVDFDSLAIWSPSAVNIIHPRDIDQTGALSLSTLIHCASDASVQFQNRIGMTSSYMHDSLIGFATMAYQIGIGRLPTAPGAIIEIESALAHIGRTSLRMAHRVVDGQTRALIATVAQFGVHFDRKARRGAEIPDAIRKVAQELARK
jgi:acyl-CoA thioester hydrolase